MSWLQIIVLPVDDHRPKSNFYRKSPHPPIYDQVLASHFTHRFNALFTIPKNVAGRIRTCVRCAKAMEPFRQRFTKTVTKFLTQQPPVAEQRQKRNSLHLTRSERRKIVQLARSRGTTFRRIFHKALTLGLNQIHAEGVSIRAWYTLTPKEREVTALICIGYSNEEIGDELSIAISTVKAHIGNILAKFKVRNRTQLRNRLAWWNASEWLLDSD